jgi:hypothetical protein
VAVLGTVSIVMVGRIALRLFGSVPLAAIASLLLAFEGLHFTMSRTALLDMVVMFFALAGFGALLSISIAQTAAHSLIKLIPGWGTVAGAVSGAVGSYVVVGAIGRAVNYHFEQDGKTTGAELRRVFHEQKADVKKSYEADKERIERARAEHAPELEALAQKLEAKEITKAEYEKKLEALGQASATIAQQAYAASEGAAAGAGTGDGAASEAPKGAEGDVVDAEFEEVKDKGRKAS